MTTALAFAVLLFSPLVPFQQFGLVTGITILYALLVSIVVVPPMLIVWAAYHQWRAESDPSAAPADPVDLDDIDDDDDAGGAESAADLAASGSGPAAGS